MDREVLHLRDSLISRYAELVYYGYWFAPNACCCKRSWMKPQRKVNGTVRLKLYKGNCTVTGRRSDWSLYRKNLATFEEDQGYRQQDAEGFIRLNALRLAINKSQGTSRSRGTSRRKAPRSK